MQSKKWKKNFSLTWNKSKFSSWDILLFIVITIQFFFTKLGSIIFLTLSPNMIMRVLHTNHMCVFIISTTWKEISAKNLHTYIFYYPFSPHIWRSSQILFIIFSSSLRRGIFISLAHYNKPCTYANVYTYVKTF